MYGFMNCGVRTHHFSYNAYIGIGSLTRVAPRIVPKNQTPFWTAIFRIPPVEIHEWNNTIPTSSCKSRFLTTPAGRGPNASTHGTIL